MSMQGMADLYRIKPDLLERFKFTIEPLKPSSSHYVLDDYLSSFLQDRDRSQLYYCDLTLVFAVISCFLLYNSGAIWSGPPDIYLTQITEYSIFCSSLPFGLYHRFVRPDWSFREHLSRALPTGMIFYLLRSTCSERL